MTLVTFTTAKLSTEPYVYNHFNKYYYHLLMYCLLFGSWQWGHTQVSMGSAPVTLTLPPIALMDIEPDEGSTIFYLDFVTMAGEPVTNHRSVNNEKWINYTAAVDRENVDGYQIQVQLANGTLPPGVSVTVEAGPPIQGWGELGHSAGPVVLSEAGQILIQNIGGSFTGNGVDCGHQLFYELVIHNPDLSQHGNCFSVDVYYTITD